ncbi:MAG TPA: aldo/keto reductase [Actinophytocola sp.]|jgi:diketogulonate reductase-like aldo/keto reductase|uniref:aldo/keto reductase n=1 Tax=Actinophytocola sp. TaxID=1872138 RepID=UPI002F92ADF2
MTIPNLTLNNGVAMPQLGFGVFQVPNEETAAAVGEALRAGYRSIDTAKAYGNEEGVAQALRESGIPRDELFITTKLWNDDHGYDSAVRAFEGSRQRLGLDYVDLYLIHWPTPRRDDYVETWQGFEKLLADGVVRAIGVSNFQPAHLRRLVDETGTVPAVNQIELHPYLQQAELRGMHGDLGIATEAWSPLAKGGDLLGEHAVTELAAKHDRTPAQVVLRWHLQLGNVVIPKSVTPARIRENLDVFGFELDTDDVARLSTLERGLRTGPNPDIFN